LSLNISDRQSGLPYRLVDSSDLSYRQIYARDCNCPERGIPAGPGEHQGEIHSTITSLNQQNREYYSLRFGEVQKELSGMRVELGKIE